MPSLLGSVVQKVGQFGKALGEAPSEVFKGAQKARELIGKATAVSPEQAKKSGLIQIPGSKTYIDPTGAVGSLERFGANVAKKAVGEAIQRKAVIANAVRAFTNKADEIVKVRKAGNGSIKITRGELELMKNMGDLKPTIGERYFQNPIRVFEELGQPVKELFYRPVKAAENIAIETKNFYNKQFNDVIKGLGEKSSRRIMAYALSQEPDGAKIIQANKLKVPQLSDKELGAYEYIRTRYDNLLDELNEARSIVGKEAIQKRENYITHIRDLNVLEQMGFSPITDDIETLLANKIHRNMTAFQFAKRRTGGLKDVELDAFNVFRKYQEKAVDHIKLTPAIAKVRELSRTIIPDGESKFKLKDKAPNAFKYISDWTDYVAGQKVQSNMPKVLENVLQKLNQNIAFATLSGNIRSAVIQPSAIINSVTELGPKNVGVGIKDLLRGRGDFALEHSNVLKGRQFETAIQEIANSALGKGNRLKTKLGEAGIKPLQFLDSLTAQSTWLGAYNRAVSQLGKAGQAAYDYADDIVTKTQASAARSDVAKIQRSTLGKVGTQFQTFVINDFNRIMRDVIGIGNTEMTRAQAFKKAATYLTGVSLWNYLSEDVLGIPSPFPRPLKSLSEGKVGEAVKDIGGQIPVVGGALRYGTGTLGAAADLTNQIFQKVNGKYTPSSWWELAGKVFGVPGTAQFKKTIKGIEGLEDGYTVTTNNGKRIKIKFYDTVDQVRALLFGPYETKAAEEVRSTGKRPKNPNK